MYLRLPVFLDSIPYEHFNNLTKIYKNGGYYILQMTYFTINGVFIDIRVMA